jgi:alkylhydroperoxidase family enzyme
MRTPATIPGYAATGAERGHETRRPTSKPLELVYLRASQINGCGVGIRPNAKKSGETDKRPFQSRRDGTIVTDAECTVLALTEAVTRIGERADSVPDEIWDEATGHYDGRALAA